MIVMDYCKEVGAKVIFEWPSNNLYWKLPKVKKYFQQERWSKCNIHGCAYGLVSSVATGRPIKKPWTLATDMLSLFKIARKCDCYSRKGESPPRLRRGEKHAPCAGKDTKLTESYPLQLAKEFHSMFKRCPTGASQ